MVAQGPVYDDDKNESCKAWTMEMLMNDGDISMSMTNEQESMCEHDKSSYMQGCTLKPLDTVSHAPNNQMTKGGRQIQKHDDGRNGFNSLRVESTQM